jgi:serine protease Do
MRRLVLVLVPIAALLAGCVSQRMSTMPATLAEVRARDIKDTLDAGNYLKAIQDIESLQRRSVSAAETGDLSGFRARAIDGVASAFVTSVGDGGDLVKAFLLFKSLQALDEQSRFPDWSAARIAARIVEERLKAEDTVSAALYATRAMESGVLQGAALESMARAFADKGLASLFEQLKSGASAATPTATMLKGTATIWVDRGIRFEGGVGLPDRATGSGFFVDARGYLLTNYHVVQSEVDPKYEGYSRLFVRLPRRSEERIPAKVVAWDPVLDLALLKVEVKPEYVFPVFADPAVTEGQKVIAIGSPVGPILQNTVTSGIVSSTGRRGLLQIGDVLQIDAAVNPGNSGGPLLDERGELLGVVFAGYKPFEGLNFAIPQHWVRKALPALMRGGQVNHPWVGAALMEGEQGLEVVYTVPGEPAERAGLRAGDRIVTIDGREFAKIRDLQDYLLELGPDTLIKCTWSRQGSSQSGVLQLDKRPRSPIELALAKDASINLLPPLFGLRLEQAGGFLWEPEYAIRQVVPGSVADNTGLSVGDTLNIQMWRVDDDQRYAVLQIFVKKRKAGYLERVIALAASIDPDSFV